MSSGQVHFAMKNGKAVFEQQLYRYQLELFPLEPVLIYTATQTPVKTGDVVHVGSNPYIVEEIVAPHKPSSTGRVRCTSMCDSKYFMEWFPGVIGASWIGRTDQ